MNMMKILSVVLPAFALTPTCASAQVIDLTTLYGTWDVQDQFSAPGTFFDHSYFAPVAATLKYTDLFIIGDEYNIFINGTLLFSALSPPNDGTFIADPDAAFASGKFTKGLIHLLAGDTVEFQILTIPPGFTDATLAVTAITPVPEPAAWGMLIAGAGFAGAAIRSRRRKLTVRYA